MNEISTDVIEKRLETSKDFDVFFKENKHHLSSIHPGQYISEQLKTKRLKKKDFTSYLNINTGYIYEILRQEKRPERDKMLQFAFALKLDYKETQIMLKRCGYAILYSKNKRDSVMIFCIGRKKSLTETDILLHKYNFSTL